MIARTTLLRAIDLTICLNGWCSYILRPRREYRGLFIASRNTPRCSAANYAPETTRWVNSCPETMFPAHVRYYSNSGANADIPALRISGHKQTLVDRLRTLEPSRFLDLRSWPLIDGHCRWRNVGFRVGQRFNHRLARGIRAKDQKERTTRRGQPNGCVVISERTFRAAAKPLCWGRCTRG